MRKMRSPHVEEQGGDTIRRRMHVLCGFLIAIMLCALAPREERKLVSEKPDHLSFFDLDLMVWRQRKEVTTQPPHRRQVKD